MFAGSDAEALTKEKAKLAELATFSAAVGINSTFLLPYTLLARGWGKEHHGLSRFDLISGTLLPFCLVTSLVIIAAGCTIYNPEVLAGGSTKLSPTEAAAMFESAGLSIFFSRIVFGRDSYEVFENQLEQEMSK